MIRYIAIRTGRNSEEALANAGAYFVPKPKHQVIKIKNRNLIAILLVVVIAAALGWITGTAIAQSTPPPQPTVLATTPLVQDYQKPKKLCPSARKFRSYVRKIYAQDKITKSELERAYELRRCLRPWSIRYQRNLGKQRQHRLEIKRLTPYPGPNGTRWAIPWSVVNCEREKRLGISGIWGSDNPTSNAQGPYQLLGHGQPWPAHTAAAKLAHHRIAGNLYRSYGLSPWKASQGCWG